MKYKFTRDNLLKSLTPPFMKYPTLTDINVFADNKVIRYEWVRSEYTKNGERHKFKNKYGEVDLSCLIDGLLELNIKSIRERTNHIDNIVYWLECDVVVE